MKDFIIAWTPVEDGDFTHLRPRERATVGKVLVSEHPDYEYKTKDFSLTVCAHHGGLEGDALREQEYALVSMAFLLLMDGIGKDALLREFAKIDLWRDMGILKPYGYIQRLFIPGKYDRINPYNP